MGGLEGWRGASRVPPKRGQSVTTARSVAQRLRAVDLEQVGRRPCPCRSGGILAETAGRFEITLGLVWGRARLGRDAMGQVLW